MILERWELLQRRRGNIAAAEIAQVLHKQYGDFPFTKDDSLPTDEKVLVEQETKERANELREKYQQIFPKLEEIPLSRFDFNQVKDFKGLNLNNILEFRIAYLHQSHERSEEFYTWIKQYQILANRITQFLINTERETLEKIGLTEKENTPLPELGLNTRTFNCIVRFTGRYRGKGARFDFGEIDSNYSIRLPSAEEAGTLAMRTEKELSQFRNLGEKSLTDIKQKLNGLGLVLASDL